MKCNTYYNMIEPWTHYVKWKKPGTKGHTLYDYIYIKCSYRQIYREQEQINDCLGLEGDGLGRNEEWLLLGIGFFAGKWKNGKTDYDSSMNAFRRYWTTYFIRLKCIVCELDLNKALKTISGELFPLLHLKYTYLFIYLFGFTES